MTHSHSHRARLRRRRQPDTADPVLLPRDARQRELDRQAKRHRRIERRELRKAQGPREVVVRVPGMGQGVAGQTRGGIGVPGRDGQRLSRGMPISRWVYEAEGRRIAREAREAASGG